MHSINTFSNTLALGIGILAICILLIGAEKAQKRSMIRSLCKLNMSYGTVMETYYDAIGLTGCVARCMRRSWCVSCIYDDSDGACYLNSKRRNDFPTCSPNVKYAQVIECLTVNEYRICGLDLFDVDGEVKGYIEVNINGVWGTVCDDQWEDHVNGLQNAQVFCRSIGFCNGTPVYPLGSQSIHTGPIVMDNVMCTGTELDLLECYYSDLTQNCIHAEDVRVRCFN